MADGNNLQASSPFIFHTRLHLTELTGLCAVNIEELLRQLQEVGGACVYHHTHRFLQQHQYLSPEPPNDFAYWITETLGETELGEKLASIDTIQYSSIESLRQKLVETIQTHIENNPAAKKKFANTGEEFHWIKSISFILSTHYSACDLKGFLGALKRITIDSIYFHIFEARLRLERKTNDFSYWIETSLGDKALADAIAKLDPYTYTLDDLRKKLIRLVEKRIV